MGDYHENTLLFYLKGMALSNGSKVNVMAAHNFLKNNKKIKTP